MRASNKNPKATRNIGSSLNVKGREIKIGKIQTVDMAEFTVLNHTKETVERIGDMFYSMKRTIDTFCPHQPHRRTNTSSKV